MTPRLTTTPHTDRSSATIRAQLLGCASVLALGVSATALGVTLAPDTAYAQAVCATQDGKNIDDPAQGNASGGLTATACGNGAVASAKDATAVGSNANAGNVGATAVGAGSKALGLQSTAVGTGSKALGDKSAAFGLNSVAAKGGATAVGPGAAALNGASAAFGSLTSAEGLGSVAVGGDIDGPDGMTNKGARAIGDRSIAIGGDSQTLGESAIAIGTASKALGELSTAVGTGSKALGDKSAAFGLNSVAAKGGATAVGPGAAALNGASAAFGSLTSAEGLGSVAIGGDIDGPDGDTNKGARASGDRSIAIGGDTQALGESAIAIGTGASATHSNSAAFGAGATATRADQQVFGTATNTYTMPGITSGASKDAQGAPTHIVTTNTSGDLAAHTIGELGLATQGDVANLQDRINGLGRRDEELADGIAISLALAQPIFQPGQSFAIRAGWGNFEGSNAVGITAAGVVGRGYWGSTSSVVIDAGVGTGTSEGVVAGRAGLTFGW